MAESKLIAVNVSNVHREFHIGEITIHALRGINIEVYEGEFVVVLGPSGSGKTTLLNQIGGIDSPTKGSVKIRESDITEWSSGKLSEYRRNKVGWIFQFFNLIPSLRAWENVALSLEFKGIRNGVKKRAKEMLIRMKRRRRVNRDGMTGKQRAIASVSGSQLSFGLEIYDEVQVTRWDVAEVMLELPTVAGHTLVSEESFVHRVVFEPK